MRNQCQRNVSGTYSVMPRWTVDGHDKWHVAVDLFGRLWSIYLAALGVSHL